MFLSHYKGSRNKALHFFEFPFKTFLEQDMFCSRNMIVQIHINFICDNDILGRI